VICLALLPQHTWKRITLFDHLPFRLAKIAVQEEEEMIAWARPRSPSSDLVTKKAVKKADA